ncbi:MAG: hydrogenase maturation protease [Actinomycetota bacterium]|nr:hydrogenase maturation protease [Actinomycetota bacterium]
MSETGRVSALQAVGYGESALPPAATVVVGCGNLLRGDDALGPILVRELAGMDLGAHVALVDGGTAGFDVAFRMRGAKRAILVDACLSGGEPGTIYKVPASRLVELPPLDGLHSHAFRWDHALALAQWLLGDEMPLEVTVFLVEAQSLEIGDPLSPLVDDARAKLVHLISDELAGARP